MFPAHYANARIMRTDTVWPSFSYNVEPAQLPLNPALALVNSEVMVVLLCRKESDMFKPL
jgi:hypothetical protein